MNKSESIVKIASALLGAQKEMGDAVKTAKNPFFKSSYSDLNAVREAAIPALNANGIGVFQPTIMKDGNSYVETLLLHESGEWISSETAIVYAKAGDPQGQGSGISYARRYGLQSLLNIGAVDDDAEAGMGRGKYTAPVAKATSIPTVGSGTYTVSKAGTLTAEQTASNAIVATVALPVGAAQSTTVEAKKSSSFRKTKPVTTAELPAVSTTDEWS